MRGNTLQCPQDPCKVRSIFSTDLCQFVISAERISCRFSGVMNCTWCCDLTRGHLCSAEVTTREIVALNHGIDPQNIQEKQTILIPAGKLSSRDKEILAGIVPLSPKQCCSQPMH